MLDLWLYQVYVNQFDDYFNNIFVYIILIIIYYFIRLQFFVKLLQK